MPHHVFAKPKSIFRELLKTLKYIMDHPDLTFRNFMGYSIGTKMVKFNKKFKYVMDHPDLAVRNFFMGFSIDHTKMVKFLFVHVPFFLWLFMGRNQYWAGRVYDLCVYYMTGTPEDSTESGLMEKPGIEPATPGLQGIALIHYTTGVPFFR